MRTRKFLILILILKKRIKKNLVFFFKIIFFKIFQISLHFFIPRLSLNLYLKYFEGQSWINLSPVVQGRAVIPPAR